MKWQKLMWRSVVTGLSRRAKCALHDRPLFNRGDKYRCSHIECGKESNK